MCSVYWRKRRLSTVEATEGSLAYISIRPYNLMLSQIMEEDKHMVLVTIRMVAHRKKHGEALKILKSTAEWSRIKPGCISSRIYEDAQQDNVIMFEEIWRSEEALACHLRSDDYQKVLLVLEMAVKQPEIRFDTISSSTGIETVEKARSHGRRRYSC
jgi:quinol monooxygenase YgiN